MNEQRRAAYLDAIGIAEFLPRQVVTAARPSTRVLRRIEAHTPTPAVIVEATSPDIPVHVNNQRSAVVDTAIGEIGNLVGGLEEAPAAKMKRAQHAPQERPEQHKAPRHRVLLVRTGNVVWLEDVSELADHAAQKRLIVALSQALGLNEEQPASVETLVWPLASANRNVDLGTFSEFLQSRLIRDLGSQADMLLVYLGEACVEWCDGLAEYRQLTTHSAGEMLSEPTLKQAVWQELREHIQRG